MAKKIDKKIKDETPDIVEEALKKLSEYKIGETPITDYIDRDDLWVQTRKRKSGVVIMSHEAIERLAGIAKIKVKQIKLLISPQASNEQQHAFLVVAENPKDETTSAQIGEASNRNTSGISRKYLASMAYKRGYDKSVLKVLGIEGVYGEVEADEFSKAEVSSKISNDELSALQVVLSAINKAENKNDLLAGLKKVNKDELSEEQKVYLSRVFAHKYAILTLSKNGNS